MSNAAKAEAMIAGWNAQDRETIFSQLARVIFDKPNAPPVDVCNEEGDLVGRVQYRPVTGLRHMTKDEIESIRSRIDHDELRRRIENPGPLMTLEQVVERLESTMPNPDPDILQRLRLNNPSKKPSTLDRLCDRVNDEDTVAVDDSIFQIAVA